MSDQKPMMVERRRDVRVRPSHDYEVRAELVVGPITSPLQVVDMSVRGIGVLVSRELAVLAVDDEVVLRISVPGAEPCALRARIRHIGPRDFGVCGLEFIELDETAKVLIHRCVSELLQRGQRS